MTGPTPSRRAWRRTRSQPGFRIGTPLLLVVVLCSLLAPWLATQSPAEADLNAVLAPPSSTHLCGTDAQGRDLLSRLLWGGRVSLWVGLLGTLVSLLLGVPYGAIAGFCAGRIDTWMMRLVDFLNAIPLTVLVLFLFSVLLEYRDDLTGLGIGRLELFYLVLGLLFWLPMARTVRAEALRLRESEFVQAARAQGARPSRILFRHVLPHLMPTVLVLLTLTIPRVILHESFLSFLGLGVEPPAVSWGLLAAEGLDTLNPLVGSWWLLAYPAAALATTLLSLNLLGDAVSDALSPRERPAS